MSAIISTGTGLLLILWVSAVAATTDFQQWTQQQSAGLNAQKDQFQEYKDQRDKAFLLFLKKQWKAVDIVTGKPRDDVPKPLAMPVAENRPMTRAPASSQVSVSVPDLITVNKALPLPVNERPDGESFDVDFYGKTLRFNYDHGLKRFIKLTLDNQTISRYWSSLSRENYQALIEQLQVQKHNLALNDWAYALLINKVANKIYVDQRNERELFSWFLLVKSGYEARIAYSGSRAYLLVPSQQEMFEVAYFTFDGKRYYAIGADGNQSNSTRVYTYEGQYPGAIKSFDMRVTPMMSLGGDTESRRLVFAFDKKQYKVTVAYEPGRIQYLQTYPQLNLSLYFSSSVYKVTATSLQKQLAGYMKGMSEVEAVNFLLRFVQTSLKYQTDIRQFGRENYMFPEETLFYPYSDCEDRAVLFAWLVKSLLKLDVIGLDYPGHVATAVHFTDDVAGDSVRYNGKQYSVTDPTYINARVGMSMPIIKQYNPAIIVY